MRIIWASLCMLCALALVVLNAQGAIELWGGLGGFFSVAVFPIMVFVVPIALIVDGTWPFYWLLLPAVIIFGTLWKREER